MNPHDLPHGFYEIDFPSNRLRLTHVPSGHTALRHDFMFDGEGAEKWSAKLNELAEAHPRAHGIYNARGALVADIRDYPALGGGFRVGDLVVTRNEDGDPVAREIVSAFPNGHKDYRQPGEPDEAFYLEDGNTLYFSLGDGGWMAAGTHGERTRARRVLPEDDVEAIWEPAPKMLRRAARRLAHDLNQNRELHAAATADTHDGETDSDRRRRYAALSESLHESWVALVANPADAAAYEAGVAAVAEARDFVESVQDSHRGRYPEDESERSRIGRELLFIEALSEGLRRRGPLPESPEAGDDGDSFAP